jgi:hypothetical protein
LFCARCPSAVVRLVATVIVDAVYGVLQRRPFAHVAEKGFEAIPSFTDGDALRAVFHVAGVVGVEAPHTNGYPHGIRRCASHSMRAGLVYSLAAKPRWNGAAATAVLTTDKIAGERRATGSAIADAFKLPGRTSVRTDDAFSDGQSAESISDSDGGLGVTMFSGHHVLLWRGVQGRGSRDQRGLDRLLFYPINLGVWRLN